MQRLVFPLSGLISLLSCWLLAFSVSAQSLKDLNGHFPFSLPESVEQWQQRADSLKLQARVSLGLWPSPELDAVQPAIYGKVLRDDYTIEKVTFESLPGLFVTGNLYRPKQIEVGAKLPAVLCPHGHWDNARFYDAGEAAIAQLLANGSERFENAARNHIQARCVQLARMGCVVFHWDMLGYCDSQQINAARAHRFREQSAASEKSDDGWLLYSSLAESHLQSVLGLQILAVQRAVDMLLTLPDVDPQRIAITGASGGGTQSFIGAALDERIAVAFPAVMVSTGMQGGCTCENACLLRVGTGNVELAGLIAPRPLGLTAADDWTATMPEDGFPELKKLYELVGAKEHVALFPALHFGHNFNHVSRVAMYGWISDYFKLGFKKPILERDFELAGKDELSVWDDSHPMPESGELFERKLLKLWAKIVDQQLQALEAGDQQQVAQLEEILTGGWSSILGLNELPARAEASWDVSSDIVQLEAAKLPGWSLTHRKADQADLDESANLRVTVTDDNGTRHVFFPAVVGQSWDAMQLSDQQSLVENPRLAAAYTYGYNLPVFAQQAQQLGLTIHWLQTVYPQKQIAIFGRGRNAALAAAGAFVSQQHSVRQANQVGQIELNLVGDGFQFADCDSIRSINFLPGAARYQDLDGLIRCLGDAVDVKSNP